MREEFNLPKVSKSLRTDISLKIQPINLKRKQDDLIKKSFVRIYGHTSKNPLGKTSSSITNFDFDDFKTPTFHQSIQLTIPENDNIEQNKQNQMDSTVKMTESQMENVLAEQKENRIEQKESNSETKKTEVENFSEISERQVEEKKSEIEK